MYVSPELLVSILALLVTILGLLVGFGVKLVALCLDVARRLATIETTETERDRASLEWRNRTDHRLDTVENELRKVRSHG